MPEIPEIEGLLAFLTPRISGTRVADVQAAASSAIKTASPQNCEMRGLDGGGLKRSGRAM